jgi:hypothetical protein
MYGRTPINQLPELEDIDVGIGEGRDDMYPRNMYNPRMNEQAMNDPRNSNLRMMPPNKSEMYGPIPETAKFIRNPFRLSADSGMNTMGNMAAGEGMANSIQIRDSNMRDSNMRDSNMRDSNMRESNMRESNMRESDNDREEYEHHRQIMRSEAGKDPANFNCVDIAKHIQDCPICSRFYNNDRTVYIIAIVVLSIVCLLLLKRILNV